MPDQEDYSVYELADHVWITEIAPGYAVIHLSNNHGTAAVALHGAHLIDYIPAQQQPVIFISQEAIYREGKAIRGGIPICWPWFNAHPSDSSEPSHGYARNQFWKLTGSDHSSEDRQEITSVTLEIVHDQLRATATITLEKSLEVSLTTTNISEKNQIQTVGGALHSYFRISDIEEVSITGLEGTQYIDTLTESDELKTQAGKISINQEIDNIYVNTSATVSIYDQDWNRTIIIEKTGSQSTVVWNPWIEKSSGMRDLRDIEYRDFVCVEAANARSDIYELAPQASHTLSTKITSV